MGRKVQAKWCSAVVFDLSPNLFTNCFDTVELIYNRMKFLTNQFYYIQVSIISKCI